MTGDVMLAVDGGGTRTRAMVITREGTIAGAAEAGPSNDLQVGIDAALASLTEAADDALRAAGLTRPRVAAAAAGLAGVDYDGAGSGLWVEAFGRMGFRRALVYGDMIAAHSGALAGAPGIVAVAGTGSVIVGVDEGGTTVKVGGWGPAYGNEGSAYGIGRDGLRAAARAWDGRGPATVLTEALAATLGVPHFERSIDAVYGRRMGQQEIAALAPLVYRAAETGDPVSDEICEKAAADLVAAVHAAFRRLRSAPVHAVSYQGSVLRSCDRIRAAFTAGLTAAEPSLVVRPPRHEPVTGAFILGCRALGWDASLALQRLEQPARTPSFGSGGA